VDSINFWIVQNLPVIGHDSGDSEARAHLASRIEIRNLRWLRLFGQVFRFLSGRIVQLVVVVGGGNVKIGFIDFQGLVGRSENSSIVFRAFHETGISTACFVAR